jgi:hypothetical protein
MGTKHVHVQTKTRGLLNVMVLKYEQERLTGMCGFCNRHGKQMIRDRESHWW